MNENVWMALDMMWQGMAGLFIVMGVTALLVFGLVKSTAPKEKEEN